MSGNCDILERMFDSSELAAAGSQLAGELAGVCLTDLDEDGLVGVVAAAERLARWAAAVQLAAVGELVRRRAGPQFVEDEIAAELRISRPAAAHRLGLALQLEQLPAVAGGLAGGRVDLPKARAIIEAVGVLDPPAAAALAAQAVDRAGGQTVGQLRAWLRRAVLAGDPAAGQARHEQAVADRRVALGAVGDGMAELWALLPADDAARAYAAVDGCARDSADPGDPRSADQRRADALVDLLTGQRTAPANTTVAVTVPLATLLSACTAPDTPAEQPTQPPGQLAGEQPGQLAAEQPGQPPGKLAAEQPGQQPGKQPTQLAGQLAAEQPGQPPGKQPTQPAGQLAAEQPGQPPGKLAGQPPGELAGIGPVPAPIARRLAADGLWRWLGAC
jgi:hypothetical protein